MHVSIANFYMTNYLIHKKTGNIVTPKSKKIIHYSYNDFIESVVKGNCCFICGTETDSKVFNDEHVIPNWILKHYAAPQAYMILPNNATLPYSKYKVPCCQECNSRMGIQIEEPMGRFLRRPYGDIIKDLQTDGRWYFRLYHWLCLIFFKTHYKDSFLRMERDNRVLSGTIADTYCWHSLYHIHAIARQHYTHASISNNVCGSIMVFESLLEFDDTDFDYLDNLNSQTVMLKLGGLVILAVLNDSKICLSVYKEFLSRISGPLNSIQIRELFARLRYANENIKERPRFYTAIHKRKGHRIKARFPSKIEIYQGDLERISLFKLMRYYLEEIMPKNLSNRGKLLDDIESGNAQFIFDENYIFFNTRED